MLKRRILSRQLTFRLLPAVGLCLLLAACSPGGLFSGGMMYAPHREISTDAEVLNSALTALVEGDQAGQITLTEQELSSLLRAALLGGVDDQRLIRDVTVWLEPQTVYVKLMLREGAVPLVPTEVALNFEGRLDADGSSLRFDLQRYGIGVLPILAPALLDTLETQLNVAIGPLINRSSPLRVTVDTGTITIDVP